MSLSELIDGITKSNQFASGGLLLMGVGAIGAACRKIPLAGWSWFVGQTTLQVTINDDNHAFYWLKHWFDGQRRMKTIRRVDVFNPSNDEYVFNPAPGSHWMWYMRRPIRVTLTRNEEKKEKWSKRSEYFTIKTLGRKQEFLRTFVDEIFSAYTNQRKGKPQLYRWGANKYGDMGWVEVPGYKPRPIETVLLPGELKESVVADIERFKESERRYVEMGIPYRRGYLLYGPPGTGKTSLGVALSSHFKAKVYFMRLSDMTDGMLMGAVSRVEPGGMIILEDIDCIQSTGKRQPASDKDAEMSAPLTLSGLLNVLDGILAAPGVLFFMTTNHIEKLDPALIRPGRADVKIFLGEADAEQKKQMYGRFYPGGTIPQPLLEQRMTMAELQEELLRLRGS